MKFSEEWKANISKAAKRRGGPKLTPEQRAKAIENMRKSHCVKILCVETGEVFQSLKDAAEAKGIKSGCYISAVLGGNQKKNSWWFSLAEILKEIGLPEDFLEKEEC